MVSSSWLRFDRGSLGIWIVLFVVAQCQLRTLVCDNNQEIWHHRHVVLWNNLLCDSDFRFRLHKDDMWLFDGNGDDCLYNLKSLHVFWIWGKQCWMYMRVYILVIGTNHIEVYKFLFCICILVWDFQMLQISQQISPAVSTHICFSL